jgi:hypothetical protein
MPNSCIYEKFIVPLPAKQLIITIMNKIFTIFCALLCTVNTWAHDFEMNGIYYNHLQGNEVEVTFCGEDAGFAYENNIIIPDSILYNDTTYYVSSIGRGAFLYSVLLTDVVIPNSVKEIGVGAFATCIALKNITLPDSLTCIGDWAFRDCISLIDITIPNNVKNIGNEAFAGCENLAFVNIGNGVTDLGIGTFTGTAIYNNSSNWEQGLFYIGDCLVEACDGISGACVIKDGTRFIANRAFYDSHLLTNVTIPSSVTHIGYEAFYGCESIRKINCYALVPPVLGANVFEKVEEPILYVLEESGWLYINTEGWSKFSTYIKK